MNRLLLRPCRTELFSCTASSKVEKRATFRIGAKTSSVNTGSLELVGRVIAGRTKFPFELLRVGRRPGQDGEEGPKRIFPPEERIVSRVSQYLETARGECSGPQRMEGSVGSPIQFLDWRDS